MLVASVNRKKYNAVRRFSSLLALPFFVLFLNSLFLGCSMNRELFKQKIVENMGQAGSVHVSIISVNSWQEYVEEMQPKYNLSAQGALEVVAPETALFEEKFIDALKIGLDIKSALPTSSTTLTDTLSKTDSKKTEPKATPKPEEQGESGESKSVEKKASDESILKKSNLEKIDPMLRYAAATALYQEVQMLNRYVKDAAIGKDYQGYVVRFQVSLMPAARNQPYDVYSTLSFFLTDSQCERYCHNKDFIDGKPDFSTLAKQCGNRCPEKEEKENIKKEKDKNSTENSCRYVQDSKIPAHIDHENGRGVEIIPLLVTDNLEAMLHSGSLDSTRQFAAAVALMIKGFGGSINIQDFSQQIQSILGRDLNSLMTVARVSDNTLLVRFGAMYQAESKYSMIPRTNYITLLLMVPRNSNMNEVIATSLTTMINAVEGERLKPRPNIERGKALDEIIYTYLDNDPKRPIPQVDDERDCLRKTIAELLQKVQNNDLIGFSEIVKPLFNDYDTTPDFIKSLWLEISALNVGEKYSEFSFYLPKIHDPELFKDQTVLALDDTKKYTTITLRGAEGLIKENLSAVLYVKPDKNMSGKRMVQTIDNCLQDKTGQIYLENYMPLVMEDATLKIGGKEATFTFSSLKAWGLVESKPKDMILVLNYEKDDGVEMKQCYQSWAYEAKPADKPDPGFAAKVTSKKISANKEGKGSLEVTVMFKQKTDLQTKPETNIHRAIFIELEGADYSIGSSRPENIATDDKNLKIIQVTNSGTIKLALENLNDEVPVTVSAWAGTASTKQYRHDDIRIDVVRERGK